MLRTIAVCLVATLGLAPAASADVTSVEVLERNPMNDGRALGAAGPYEEIIGKITVALDPTDPVNQVIINLDRAPTNADGLVEATADLVILAPTDATRGNSIALVDVSNRGRRSVLGFNRGGDSFLMDEGYTVVWVGWEFDVASNPGAIRIDVPPVDGEEVGGIGFAAVRDTTSWIKYEADSLVSAEHTLSFGSSQSGRFLRTFLYLGFNTDEDGRQVFDGMIPHIAGSSRLDLNRPGAEPISLGMFDATSFPFADEAMPDPVTGVIDGTLGTERSRRNQPLILYTNSSVEYWGGGRVASLIHSTPDGTRDIELPDNVRSYFFAGTQHSPGRFPPPPADRGQEMSNPTDYWWNMRALLTALRDWVVDGVEPPPSRYPTFANGNLVRPTDVDFPAIPDVRSPRDRKAGPRVGNRWLDGGDGAGAELPMFVPQVDADGNELAGVRHPEVEVPLATYTGWVFANPDRGDPDSLVALAGAYMPFPATEAERAARNDPRRSIEERYTSRDDFLAQIEAAGEKLVRERYLLEADLPQVIERAGAHWDLVAGGN